VARNALKSILGDETAAEIEKQVDAGKLSLADLNALEDKGKDISTGVLSLIFGTPHPQEVALAFLNSDTFDHDIDQKSARPQLIGLLQDVFEIDLPASIPLADGRQRLARHVLLTEFLTGLGEAAPPSLETIKIAAASAWHMPGACAGMGATTMLPPPSKWNKRSVLRPLSSVLHGWKQRPVDKGRLTNLRPSLLLSGRCCSMSSMPYCSPPMRP
jgi:hypothetical protein